MASSGLIHATLANLDGFLTGAVGGNAAAAIVCIGLLMAGLYWPFPVERSAREEDAHDTHQ